MFYFKKLTANQKKKYMISGILIKMTRPRIVKNNSTKKCLQASATIITEKY